MFQKLLQPSEFARLLACTASSAILAVGLSGCQLTSSDITGSLGDKAETSRSADPRRDLETYQERYRANPKELILLKYYANAIAHLFDDASVA